MARVGYICAACNAYNRGSDPCASCSNEPSYAKAPWDGVQIGMIDGEQIGFFPPAAGPYANPGKSLKRVLKNNNQWREMVKRSEGKIGDIS